MAHIPLITAASAILLVLSLCTQMQSVFSVRAGNSQSNDRPIIGILTQEISPRMQRIYGDRYDSYIAASYVKYVESGGARVVPIWIGQPESYYRNILNNINGVLFPGGSAGFSKTGGYADAGRIIYRIAKEMNDAGDYFPIWAACLGFELLTYLEANGIDIRSDCSSHNQILPLNFKSDYKQSRMFKHTPRTVINILKTEKVAANFHHYCVTESDLEDMDLTESFKVISVNSDKNGIEFVSSLEHVDYPFYGVQFHPEKNNYEWISRLTIPHTKNAVVVSQHFANFFVNEARKNNHHFFTEEDEARNLIYNYSPTYTGTQSKSSFEQCYFFKILCDGM